MTTSQERAYSHRTTSKGGAGWDLAYANYVGRTPKLQYTLHCNLPSQHGYEWLAQRRQQYIFIERHWTYVLLLEPYCRSRFSPLKRVQNRPKIHLNLILIVKGSCAAICFFRPEKRKSREGGCCSYINWLKGSAEETNKGCTFLWFFVVLRLKQKKKKKES